MLIPAALLVATLSTAPAAPSPPAPGTVPAKKESGIDAIALPLLSFNSDHGFGYGGVGGMYLYAPGKTPYAHALGAQVFFSSRGVQNHYLRYDGPQLIGPL